MRKYKYTKETLDVALEELQSENVVQRKNYVKFISMASRSELFGKTCDTLSVQTWFLSSDNREKLIRVLHQEAEEKIIRRRIMTPEMSKDLTDILVESIDRSKSIARMKDFRLAAKTGTSRRPKDNGVGYTNKMYTSMVGYLPASDPKILIYIVIDSAMGDVWGSTVAAPIFKDIATELAKIMNLTPDRKVPLDIN